MFRQDSSCFSVILIIAVFCFLELEGSVRTTLHKARSLVEAGKASCNPVCMHGLKLKAEPGVMDGRFEHL